MAEKGATKWKVPDLLGGLTIKWQFNFSRAPWRGVQFERLILLQDHYQQNAPLGGTSMLR